MGSIGICVMTVCLLYSHKTRLFVLSVNWTVDPVQESSLSM